MSPTPDASATDDPTAQGAWVTATTGPQEFRTGLAARSHDFVADEPLDVGGSDAGPTPYEYLLGALSACMAMTLRMYADRKRWPLERVRVSVRSARSHEQDCERCEGEDVGIHTLERRVELVGPLSAEQRARLMQIADRCPVKQTLQRELRVVDA